MTFRAEENLVDDLTAGAFAAVSGLSAKALRLYAERGILNPASVDPVTGYRGYDRGQLQHGMMLDLLRRAQVPLAELPTAGDFDFAARREAVAMQRQLEDFSLDVAERVGSFDPAEFSVRSTPAGPVDWIGVVIDLGIPDDIEGRVAAFSGLAVDLPAVERALADALAELGANPPEVTWTTVADSSRSGSERMQIARPTTVALDAASRDLIERRVGRRSGSTATVIAGTLPPRLEFTVHSSAPVLGPVDEAASGYLHLLAFEHHRAQHGLSALRTGARQVVPGSSLFAGPAPVSVFDVHPPAGL